MNFVWYKQLDNKQSLLFDEVRRASQKKFVEFRVAR